MTTDEPVAALAAQLTPSGRGALAVVGFAGDAGRLDAARLFRSRRGLSVVELPLEEPVYGQWVSADGSGDGSDAAGSGEDVVLIRRREHLLEVHCHGGQAAVERILADLVRNGARRLPWRDWLEATEGELAADWQAALAGATTWQAAGMILAQMSDESGLGGLVARLKSWTASRENAPFDNSEQSRLLAEIEQAIAWAALGVHLVEPWTVVVSGRPNVGKSSLLNALVGYSRAIVSPQAGTTRDVVTADTALDGWSIRFTDTAGLRETSDSLERSGIERAREEIALADLNLRVIDASVPTAEEDTAALGELKTADAPLIVVAHKSDLPRHPECVVPSGAVAVSSLTGDGLDALAKLIVDRLVPQTPPVGAAVPVTVRQAERLAELRQALLRDDRVAVEQLLTRWTAPTF
jgi:tRNA modification GTPase